MVVVVVIGILLTIAVPNFLRMRNNSLEAQIKSNAHTVQLVAEDFAVRNDGEYSDAAADLMPLMPEEGCSRTRIRICGPSRSSPRRRPPRARSVYAP